MAGLWLPFKTALHKNTTLCYLLFIVVQSNELVLKQKDQNATNWDSGLFLQGCKENLFQRFSCHFFKWQTLYLKVNTNRMVQPYKGNQTSLGRRLKPQPDHVWLQNLMYSFCVATMEPGKLASLWVSSSWRYLKKSRCKDANFKVSLDNKIQVYTESLNPDAI